MGAFTRGVGHLTERWAPGDGVDRVLVVTAHPDDVDFGAAGSVAAFTEAGVEVAYCIVTDGDAGGDDRTISRSQMAAVRRDEQRAAGAMVGVSDISFLGYPDGRVTASLELRRDISRLIRRFRPQRVLAQSPERRWDRIYASHPDHLAAGEAATCAVYPDARNPFAHPELLAEGLEPHTVGELWLMAAPTTAASAATGGVATVAVGISSTVERKIAALQCHRSQVADPQALADRMHEWAGATAAEWGLPPGSMVEVFQVVQTG